jgi:aryl-alcohol dehydrogenase-like predicted oxidoreductase
MAPPAFLCLGTVQTGIAYGVVNRQVHMDEAAAYAIYDAAMAEGITCFDTAAAYGVAEERIGRWRSQRHHAGPRLITKFSKLAGLDDTAARVQIMAQVDASAAHLGVARIDGLLAHGAGDIQRPAVQETLAKLVETGRIGSFGASVYDPVDAEKALQIPGLGLLQIPLSLFNQVFHGHAVLQAAAERGIEVHARSIFLQGLLLQKPQDLPPFARPLAPALEALHTLSDRHGCRPDELALASVAGETGIRGLLIGCDSPQQVRENARAFRSAVPGPAIAAAWEICKDTPAELADPRRWPKQVRA